MHLASPTSTLAGLVPGECFGGGERVGEWVELNGGRKKQAHMEVGYSGGIYCQILSSISGQAAQHGAVQVTAGKTAGGDLRESHCGEVIYMCFS